MKKWCRLGDVTTKIGSGITPRGGQSGYIAEGVPLIRSQNVHLLRFVPKGLAHISAAQDAEMVQSRVRPNDVHLNITGASIGRVCVAPATVCPANVNQHVSIIRPKETELHPSYLAAYLASPGFQEFIRESQAGATRQALTKEMLQEFAIPHVPMAEQERIASELTSAMATVETARRAAEERLAAAETLPTAYPRDVFGSTGGLSASPVLPSVPIHPDWTWHPLRTLARLATGHTPSRRHPEFWKGDIPWLQLPDIRAVDARRVFSTAEYTNMLGISNSAAVLLPRDTVCLSRTASVGFVTILGREMATSQDFVNWVCGPELVPDFLMWLLIASRRYVRDLGSGATHHTIYFPTVEAFSVCVPSWDEQRRLAAELSERIALAGKLIAHCRAELEAIDALPAALLREVFGGAEA